jgi:protein-S-isoprenylcysteine O-methyltransferase Ste14
MGGEDVFRIAALVLVTCALPIGLYFRLRSLVSGERLSRRAEGWLLVPLRLCGLLFISALAVFLIDPELVGWAALPLPAAVRWLGVGLGCCCLPLLFWVMRTLGTNLTDTVVTRARHTLVTTGPYRWVRHPFYCVGVLWFAALTAITASGLLLAIGLAAFVLLALRTPIEERKLLERFGDEYREYMSRTGPFWPRWPAPAGPGR